MKPTKTTTTPALPVAYQDLDAKDFEILCLACSYLSKNLKAVYGWEFGANEPLTCAHCSDMIYPAAGHDPHS